MLFIIFLCLKKIIKDIAYTINAARGKFDTYVPVEGFNSEDVELSYYSDFNEVQSGFNKEYKEHIEEGELEIDYDNPEEVEYYQDYETDAIDFNEEKSEYRTIYGEEYTRPTLEKDIQTYGGYEYDSMDFAQPPVEKKDIDKF